MQASEYEQFEHKRQVPGRTTLKPCQYDPGGILTGYHEVSTLTERFSRGYHDMAILVGRR